MIMNNGKIIFYLGLTNIVNHDKIYNCKPPESGT